MLDSGSILRVRHLQQLKTTDDQVSRLEPTDQEIDVFDSDFPRGILDLGEGSGAELLIFLDG